jgi:hypothetical protein
MWPFYLFTLHVGLEARIPPTNRRESGTWTYRLRNPRGGYAGRNRESGDIIPILLVMKKAG